MLYILLTALLAVASCHEFKTKHSWKVVDYDFKDEATRNDYLTSGKFIPKNNMPLGIQVWRDKVFVTVPRWRTGVVSNLNYFSKDDKSQSPVLIPYPDWETNDINSSDGITDIFRVRADECDRLWGVDTGVDDIFGNGTVVRPPRIVVIDLKTDKIIRTYNLKDSDQKSDSFFVEIVIDVDSRACNDAHAYIADLTGFGMVVYSWAKNDSWRINHNFFYFDPIQGDYNVKGINFQWTDGLFGMSLSPPNKDGFKTLYFHPMSGITEFSVSTQVLQDEKVTDGHNFHAFHVVGEKGPKTQGPSSLIDMRTGVDYFTQVNRNGIACWDTSVVLNPTTFVLVGQNNETMVFPNDLAIDVPMNILYVLSDNLPQLQYSEYDVNEYNFFITIANLDELTPFCKPWGSSRSI